jgi:hypothetical protein
VQRCLGQFCDRKPPQKWFDHVPSISQK